VYFILTLKKGVLTRIERIGAEKVRTNKDKSIYSVNQDWQYVSEIKTYIPYHPECKDGVYIYVYEKTSLGQDIYPLPSYTSAMNWIYLDGEMSYLHKSNIQNSVFPAFMMMFPKKFQSPEEMQMVKNTVEAMKGAKNAGKTAIFSANTKEQLPEMVAVPTNNNDQLFIQTDGRIDEKICQSHQIDPLLMGIRVSGKLGSGMELPQLTQTFEKNVILPLREEVEEIFNDFLDIAGINAEFVCKEFQVIDEKIVDKTQTVKTES
jgi:capsid portal protein